MSEIFAAHAVQSSTFAPGAFANGVNLLSAIF
jgi:hypothetical protein